MQIIMLVAGDTGRRDNIASDEVELRREPLEALGGWGPFQCSLGSPAKFCEEGATREGGALREEVQPCTASRSGTCNTGRYLEVLAGTFLVTSLPATMC